MAYPLANPASQGQAGVAACLDPETWYPDLMEAIQNVPSLETFHFPADATYEPLIFSERMTAAQYVVEIKRAYEKESDGKNGTRETATCGARVGNPVCGET